MRRCMWLLLAISLAALSPSAARAQSRIPGPLPPVDGVRTVPTLREQLEMGLRVQRPQDFEFIAHVVRLVDRGVLPESMVNSTFLWARRKSGKFAPQYFERALRIRAANQGIRI